MYRLQAINKRIVERNRLFDRRIVRLTEADGLKQLAPNVFKAAGLAEIDSAAEFVLIDGEVEDFGFAHDSGNCSAIGFIYVCVASELVEFLDAFSAVSAACSAAMVWSSLMRSAMPLANISNLEAQALALLPLVTL